MKRFRQIFITVVISLLLFSALAYGDSWTGNKRLTNNAGNSSSPATAVDVSNIDVVWEDNTPGNLEIYFKKSDDGGVTWTTNKRLTTNAGARYPSIAVNGPNIYVVWTAYATPGSFEIYFKKSDDGGATWSANERLTNNAGTSSYPAIAVDNSNIYVVWQNFMPTPGSFEIYFKKSDDGGATWTTSKRHKKNEGPSLLPAIAV